MKQFAKTFQTEACGQLVAMAKLNDDDNSPEVRCYMVPTEGLDVSSVGYGFSDDEEGEGKRDAFLDKFDQQMAETVAAGTVAMVKGEL